MLKAAQDALFLEGKWGDDVSYEVVPIGKTGDRFRFIGDTIQLNAENFPSLIKDPIDAPPNLTELIFDARIIYVDSPIALQQCQVKFLCEKVVFSQQFSITFTKDPPVATSTFNVLSGITDYGDGDGVTIVADEIEIIGTVDVPFTFFTAGSGIGSPTRRITMISGKWILDGIEITSPSAYDILRNMSLDGQLDRGSASSYRISLGAVSADTRQTAFFETMSWPIAFTVKLSRHFSTSPFKKETQDEVSLIIASYDARLSKWSLSGPTAELNRISAAILAGKDLNGFRRDEIPRMALKSQIKIVQDRLAEVMSGQLLSTLEQQILKFFESKDIDHKALESIRERRRSRSDDIGLVEDGVSAALIELDRVNQECAGIEDQERVARARIALELEELRRHDQNDANIRQVTHYIQVAAALLPIAAPVSLALSVGIGLAGDAIYRHNAPDAPADGSFLVTFEEVYQQAQSFRDQATKVRSAWEDFTKTRKIAMSVWTGEPLPAKSGSTKGQKMPSALEAAQNLGEAAGNVYREFTQLLDLAKVPGPQKLSQNGLEEQDKDLQDLLNRHQGLTANVTSILSNLESLYSKAATLNSELTEITNSESDMLRVVVLNEHDITLSASLALKARRSLYEALYRDTVALRLATYYANLHDVIVENDALGFIDESLARARLAIGDSPSAAFTAKWMAERFQSERDQAIAAVGNLADAVVAEQQTYTQREGLRSWGEVVTIFESQGEDNDVKQLFLTAVNLAIADQIKRPAGREFDEVTGMLFIPIDWKPHDDRRRFVAARVTGWRLQDRESLRGLTIYINIYHPGFGVLSDGVKNVQFDLRSDIAASPDWSNETVLDQFSYDHPPTKADILAEEVALRDEFMYSLARLPLRTSYFLTIKVTGASVTRSLPQLESLAITLVSIS
jgi:hypothetical protein